MVLNKEMINGYVSKHLLIIYGLFLLTGLVFFLRFSYLIKKDPEIVKIVEVKEVLVDSTKTHQMFLDEMGMLESSDDYKKVNRFGYLGRYQFSIKTLNKHLDIKCTPQEFIDNKNLQDYAMYKYLKKNKEELYKYIGKYQFTTYKGIYITESGILAAAHLGGASSVRKFFDKGKVFKDGNGTPITKYLKQFAGYSLKL